MISSRPVFFEALNETQKNILQRMCSDCFDEIDKLPLYERNDALRAIIAESVSLKEKSYLESKNLWSDIELLRRILLHPCPQNKAVGNSNAVPDDFIFFSNEADTSSGIKNGYVYYFTDGMGSEILSEKEGLLGLTGRNDRTAPFVIKEAVVNYVRQLINDAIANNQSLMGIPVNNKNLIKSVMDKYSEISETNWLVGLVQDNNISHPILYIEGIKNTEAFLNQYQIVSNPVGSIIIGHQVIPRVTPTYSGEEGVFQLFKIDPEQGEWLKKNLKSEIKNYSGRLNRFSREVSTALIDNTAHESLTWIKAKLKKINLVVDTSIFTLRKESNCIVM